MILGIDIDGVLADFNTRFIRRIVSVTKKDLFPPRPFPIPCWDYPQHFGYTQAETSAVWEDIKRDPHFWQELPAYPGTDEVLDKLYLRQAGGDEIYFVTSRVGVLCKRQTETWLSNHWFDTPTVLISSQKGAIARALGINAYIDDKYENVIDVAWSQALTVGGSSTHVRSATRTFLLNAPWNAAFGNPEHVTRVSSVMEFLIHL